MVVDDGATAILFSWAYEIALVRSSFFEIDVCVVVGSVGVVGVVSSADAVESAMRLVKSIIAPTSP